MNNMENITSDKEEFRACGRKRKIEIGKDQCEGCGRRMERGYTAIIFDGQVICQECYSGIKSGEMIRIPLTVMLKERLEALRGYGSTYNDILEEMIERFEKTLESDKKDDIKTMRADDKSRKIPELKAD